MNEGAVIRAFRAFEAGEEDRTVKDLVDQSNIHYDPHRFGAESVHACASFCFPEHL